VNNSNLIIFCWNVHLSFLFFTLFKDSGTIINLDVSVCALRSVGVVFFIKILSLKLDLEVVIILFGSNFSPIEVLERVQDFVKVPGVGADGAKFNDWCLFVALVFSFCTPLRIDFNLSCVHSVKTKLPHHI
jgi:hypothetical protein